MNRSKYQEFYNSYGPRTDLQIKSLISIIAHNYSFNLINNNFTQNTGTKGVIYLDILHRVTTTVIVANNSFTQNGGYLDASAIFIRARGPQN